MSDSFKDLSEDQLSVVLIITNKIMIPLFQCLGILTNVLNVLIFKQLGLRDSMNISFWTLSLFQCLGILTNVLNVLIFKQLGLRDSMNISFWTLSLSDTGYVLISAVINICLFVALSPLQEIIPVSLLALSGWISCYLYIFLDTSTCTQTYMALARCCCVTMPMKFKNVFTARRTALIMISVFVGNVLCRIPLVSSHGLSWQTSLLTNKTRFTIWFSAEYQFYMVLEKIAGRTLFPVIFLVVTSTCSAILGYSLAKASKKRKLMTSSKVVLKHKPEKRKPGTSEIRIAIEASQQVRESEQAKHESFSLSARELQVIKAITLVTALEAVALLLNSVFSLAEASAHEFFPGRKYCRLHATILAVITVAVNAHKSVNFVIYYAFNSRFREMLKRELSPRFMISTLCRTHQ